MPMLTHDGLRGHKELGIRECATRVRNVAVVALMGLVAAACGGSTTDLSLSDAEQLVLTALTGPGLAGTVGETTDQPVRIQVSDDQGRPVAGINVEFRLTSEDGSVSPSFVTSDAQGVAQANWVLGQRAGEHVLEVVGVDRKRPNQRFTYRLPARARPSEPTVVEVVPGVTSIEVGTLADFQAKVLDQFGNRIEDSAIEWVIADQQVAQISLEGTVYASSVGTTEVTAESSFTVDSNLAQAAAPPQRLRGRATLQVTPATPAPGRVSDLSVTSITESSVTVAFTQVEDGTGNPANYAVRYGSPGTGWAAMHPTEASVTGTQVGALLSYEVPGLEAETQYKFQVAAYRGTLDQDAVYGDLSNSVNAKTIPEPEEEVPTEEPVEEPVEEPSDGEGEPAEPVEEPVEDPIVDEGENSDPIEEPTEEQEPAVPATNPSRVTTLTVASTSTSSASLQFTQVDDGTGSPAKYAIRYGAPGTGWAAMYPTEVSVVGTEIGTIFNHEVPDLSPDQEYQFQLVSYRGTLNEDAVFGNQSNVALGKTKANTVEEPSTPAVTDVVVSPASVTIQGVDGVAQLTAEAYDASANVVTGEPIVWTSLNGTIATVSVAGLVTARALGTAMIVASTACCEAADTITVNVTEVPVADPGQVTDLQVVSTTDGTVTLRFTEVDDGTGNPAKYALRYGTPTITWWQAAHTEVSISGQQVGQVRQVEQNGLSAGTTYGFQVIAYRGTLGGEATFGTISNVASGTTTSSVAPEPVEDPATDGNVGEILTARDFLERSEDSWFLWELNSGNFEIVPDAGASHGSTVARARFPEGMGSRAPISAGRNTGWSAGDIQIDFRIKFSENWNGHPSGVNKIFYITDSSTGNHGDPAVIKFQGSGSGALRLRVSLQNPDTGTREYTENVGNVEIIRGEWQEVRVILRMNSAAGVEDGEAHGWVNGTKVIEYNNIPWSGGGDFEFDNFRWEPYWGGQHPDPLDRTQYQSMDYVRVTEL